MNLILRRLASFYWHNFLAAPAVTVVVAVTPTAVEASVAIAVELKKVVVVHITRLSLFSAVCWPTTHANKQESKES